MSRNNWHPTSGGFDLDRIQIRTGIPRHVRMFAAIDPRGMTPADAYESIPFEQEARRMQSLIRNDLQAKSAKPVPHRDVSA